MFGSRRQFTTSSVSRENINGYRPSKDEILRLLGYLKPYKLRMVIAILATLIGSALGLVFPWILQVIVDTVLTEQNYAQLNRVTVLLIGVFLLRSVFYFFQGYYLNYVGERIVTDLRIQVYTHLQDLSIRFYSDRRIGELISRLSSDVTLVRTALTNNIAVFLSQFVTFIGSLVLMLVINWRLTIFILAIAPFVAASAVIFGRRIRKLSTVVQDNLADSNAAAEEALSGIRIVKAFTREIFEIDRYRLLVEHTFNTAIRMAVYRSAFGPLITFLAFSSLAAILWFGGREVIAGRLTGGQLIAFLVYGINIAASVGAFTNLYTQLQEAAGASHRIFELLDEDIDIKDIPDAVAVSSIAGNITFKNVSFAYPGSEKVLHGINLEIQAGEVLALVGPSGAGKSTIFNLIPRFYDPTQGIISIDGLNVKSITKHSLRSNIGLVPQETVLFSGSVLENLRYGNLEASDAWIESAAAAANATEFIDQLPDGYQTMVGERGVKLSGGQRQRIAIARAVLRNPRILLLDEATSSLDSESEGLVQEALEHLMQGRTTVIIAHRLSTIHKADRIAVLDNGYLIELGTHAELIEQDGLYARLYRIQFKVEGIPDGISV